MPQEGPLHHILDALFLPYYPVPLLEVGVHDEASLSKHSKVILSPPCTAKATDHDPPPASDIHRNALPSYLRVHQLLLADQEVQDVYSFVIVRIGAGMDKLGGVDNCLDVESQRAQSFKPADSPEEICRVTEGRVHVHLERVKAREVRRQCR